MKNGLFNVKSVIVPEFYPDLNYIYLNDPCYFTSIEAYVKYVEQHGYYSKNVPYAIENNRIINTEYIHESLLMYKELGVKIIQLYCGNDNNFFCIKTGLTFSGEKLLSEIYNVGLILDLSHLPDTYALSIAKKYKGRMIISHCACSDLYSLKKSRSNSITSTTLHKLSEQIEVFGIPFLNNIIASNEEETCPKKIFDDIIEQILTFVNIVSADKVALSPDYIDTYYFTRVFKTKLVFPDILLKQEGLIAITNRLKCFLSVDDVNKILFKNVERVIAGI